ncbi:MAG: hypothetical protein ACYC6C_13620 [Coriobacteriia bacterium]
MIEKDGKPIGGFVGEIANRELQKLLLTGAQITFGKMNKSHKISKLRSLWIRQGIDEQRSVILEQYGVTSTAELSEQQLDELIQKFTQNKNFVSAETRYYRSIILKLLTEIGIYDHKGKLLFQMSIEEMKELQKKLRSIKTKTFLQMDERKRLELSN